MNEFRRLSDQVFASPQIGLQDIETASELGVSLIINNRPDGEDPGAPQSNEIAAAADSAGIDYLDIPIGHSGFSEVQIDQMISALNAAKGPVLAYCRSGTRSTFLWALAQAKTGADPNDIASAAMAAGYDISPIRAMVDMLAARG